MPVTVKARRKYGAASLDLTIPAAVCKEMDIKTGDVFEVQSEMKEGKALLTYLKVYKYRR